MSDISSAYLDTSVLWRSHWPHVSTELRNLFVLCSAGKVRVYLPEAVELEMEERSIRKFNEVRSQFTKGMSELPDVFNRGASVEPLPTSGLLEQFRKRIDKSVTTYNIQRVSFVSNTSRELFELAVRHSPPFGGKSSGLQDSIILQNVFAHISSLKESGTAMIVTNDDPFIAAIQTSGADKLFGIQLDRLVKRLKDESPLAEAKTIAQWDLETKSATEAIANKKDEVEQYIAADYGSGLTRLLLPGQQRVSVNLNRIFDVTTPIPDAGDSSRTKIVEFSFKAEVDTQTTSAQMFDPRFQGIGSSDYPAEIYTTFIRRTVEIEAKATVVNSEYKDLQFVAIRHLQPFAVP
jgi:hypothetical protein